MNSTNSIKRILLSGISGLGKTILFYTLGLSFLFADNKIETARTIVQEWVKTQKTISAEMADWKDKEATLHNLIDIVEQEIILLEEKVARGRKQLSVADKTRAKLLTEEIQLKKSIDIITPSLPEMEQSLIRLKTRLPDPLSKELESFFQRLPTDSKNTSLNTAERMQCIIGILTGINAFNNKLSLSSEIKTLSDGRRGEVKTLYLGLTSAYYLSSDGSEAGYGHPIEDKWQWESRPELSNDISNAIKIFENKTQESQFISLPINTGK